MPYGSEYLRFKSNPLLLNQIAERTGGRILSRDAHDIFQRERTTRESSKPVFDWFLIALACLIPIDVGVRRVQLDWAVVKALFGIGKKHKSTAPMGALLERKKQIQPTITPPAQRPAPIHRPTAPKPTEPKAAPPKSDAPQSTTERLLARKRKRQDGE